MKNLPFAIQETFMRLKKERKIPMAVDVVNGKYYVYRRQTKWDKENKRVMSVAEYLGKINESGIFIPKKSSMEKGLVRRAERQKKHMYGWWSGL